MPSSVSAPKIRIGIRTRSNTLWSTIPRPSSNAVTTRANRQNDEAWRERKHQRFHGTPQADSAVNYSFVGRSLIQPCDNAVHDIAPAGHGYDSRQASEFTRTPINRPGGRGCGRLHYFAVQRNFGLPLSGCAGASRRESRLAPGRFAPATHRWSGSRARYARRFARNHRAIPTSGHKWRHHEIFDLGVEAFQLADQLPRDQERQRMQRIGDRADSAARASRRHSRSAG